MEAKPFEIIVRVDPLVAYDRRENDITFCTETTGLLVRCRDCQCWVRIFDKDEGNCLHPAYDPMGLHSKEDHFCSMGENRADA